MNNLFWFEPGRTGPCPGGWGPLIQTTSIYQLSTHMLPPTPPGTGALKALMANGCAAPAHKTCMAKKNKGKYF